MHDVNNIEEELRRKQPHAAQVAYEDDDEMLGGA
jgi:DnaJ homolog subfamily A member 2